MLNPTRRKVIFPLAVLLNLHYLEAFEYFSVVTVKKERHLVVKIDWGCYRTCARAFIMSAKREILNVKGMILWTDLAHNKIFTVIILNLTFYP